MFSVIILGAGQSSRFGEDKILYLVERKPLILHSLDTYLELKSYIDTILIVSGSNHTELTKMINHLPVDIVENEKPEDGMSSSIKRGITFLEEHKQLKRGIFVHPGDNPFVSKEVIELMITEFETSGSNIIIPKFGKKRGHPILISTNLIDELKTINEESLGLKSLLERNKNDIKYIQVDDEGILKDINTKHDLI